MMDADWYVDPLERYEGRFFDGTQWTDRVSDGGVLSRDPDFALLADEAAEPVATVDEFAGQKERPAVASVPAAKPRRASTMVESPVRVVAVLDESVVGRRAAVAAANQAANERGTGRARLVVALIALVAALAIVGFLFLRSPDRTVDTAAAPVALDAEQEQRVEDLQEGGTGLGSDADPGAGPVESLQVDLPEGIVAPDAVFDASQSVQVGSLTVINGASLLDDLASWHRGRAAERGIELGADAGCWFGELGGAAVQVAQCGPVGGSADSEFLFDLVPLQFEDRDAGQVAQPIVDDVTIDAVLANALVLVGAEGGVAAPQSSQGATRGNRGSTNSEPDSDD